MQKNIVVSFVLIQSLMVGFSAFAQDSFEPLGSDEEKIKLKESAVQAVVSSHDQTLIVRGGELMVRQQVVKAAKKYVVTWGRERGFGKEWWEDKVEFQQAVSHLISIGDEVLLDKFSSGDWLTDIWTIHGQ